MKIIIARIFRFLFRFRFFSKRYYGIVFRIFQPLKLFRGVTTIAFCSHNLKMKLDIDEWIQQHIYFLGYFDQYGIRFLEKNLKQGDVFIDIGANIGSYTMVASRLTGGPGKVYAFEPVEDIYDRLKENIELNASGNIVAEKKAVYHENTELILYLSDNLNLGMSSIYHHNTEDGRVEKVEAIRLDDYFDNHIIERMDLVKIDVEGSELFALKGLQKSIEKFRPKILIELKEETLSGSDYSINDILNFFEMLGYEKYIITEQGDLSREIRKKPEGYYNFVFLPG